MSSSGFDVGNGVFGRLLFVMKYAFSALLAVFVPRVPHRWVFGSPVGVGEGALPLARELRAQEPDAQIVWIVEGEHEGLLAASHGFVPIRRRSRQAFWATLRARTVVVTHGFGDVAQFGVRGATVIHLGDGASLMHRRFDALSAARSAGWLGALFDRIDRASARDVALYAAGSIETAERLRSAHRVAPGRVRVLGDPRTDPLAVQARDPLAAAAARAELRTLLGLPLEASGERLVLYAPARYDGGEPGPTAPTSEEAQAIHRVLEHLDARLVVRAGSSGMSAVESLMGDRVQPLDSGSLAEITPHLGAFDALITDHSSIATDFSLFGRPIVWFAPDPAAYAVSRRLYEPLEVTARGRVVRDWTAVAQRLDEVLLRGSPQRRSAEADARELAGRFHAFPEGGAAARVLAEIRRLALPASERVPVGAVFFESLHGGRVSGDPLAIDREIARRLPETPRYWGVTSERLAVPAGATPVLVGGPDWLAVRRHARLLVVDDRLQNGFRRRREQTVLQTWHGTMPTPFGRGGPSTSRRARRAIRRESRNWSLLLSQNPHSTAQFRTSCAYRGEVLETGYPCNDRLARATAAGGRIDIAVDGARRALGAPTGSRVLAYVPEPGGGSGPGALDPGALAAELGAEWIVVTRDRIGGGPALAMPPGVIDASTHPDANDVLLAADLLVTDASPAMFDAAVARVPLAFFVPDLAAHRERGFAFDFAAEAPGPVVQTRAELVAIAQAGVPPTAAYDAWRARFAPWDDGHAAERVVDALTARGVLG